MHHVGTFDMCFFLICLSDTIHMQVFVFFGFLLLPLLMLELFIHTFSYPKFWEGPTQMFRSFSFDRSFLLLISPLHLPSGQQVRMLLKVIFEKNKSHSKEILVLGWFAVYWGGEKVERL